MPLSGIYALGEWSADLSVPRVKHKRFCVPQMPAPCSYKSLPKDYQQIFEMASSDAHVEMQAKCDARNPDALRRLVANGA